MRKAEVLYGFLLLCLLVPQIANANTWVAKTSMVTTRRSPGVAVVGGKLYAIGGDGTTVTEEFDPVNDTWTTMAPMLTTRWWGFGTASADGKIYAIGGASGGVYLDENEEFDPVTDTWVSRTAMPTARHGVAVGVIDDIIYVIGGRNSSGYLSVNEAYDPSTDSWITRTPMPTARYYLAVAVANGKIYAVGGYGADGNLATVEEYDPSTDSWTSKTDMLTAREELAAASLNGKIYAIGGWDGVADLAANEEYDPILDSWTTRASMITARSGLAAASVADSLYATGGLLGFSYLAVHELYYFLPTMVMETSFAVQIVACGALLSWTLSSESNVQYYFITRKRDPEYHYAEIGRVHRAGTSPSPQPYTYTDEGLIPGSTYWYKLGIKKTNGDTEWLGPCIGAVPHQLRSISIYPNPAKDNCSIRISLPFSSPVEVVIHNALGKRVCTLNRCTLKPGIHAFQWDCTATNGRAAPAGVYFCTASFGSSTDTHKFLIVR
jgi:N-acetylneuraminic acid mutarotase